MWSMSTSLAAVQVAPSYGDFHVPDVAAQEESWTTFVPSRARTTSRVLHEPDVVRISYLPDSPIFIPD